MYVTKMYYYGARYYSGRESIWLGVDLKADNYPSLSPFVYCANNPVILIDPNGKEIFVTGEDGVSFKYTQGMKYEGKDRFAGKIVGQLNKMNTNENGQSVLSELSGSKNKFSVTNNSSVPGTAGFIENKKGGGEIAMNGSTDLRALSHELFHGFQSENGHGGKSINNEVEANLFSYSVATSVQGIGIMPLGLNNPSGKKYESAMKSILFHGFNQGDYSDAICNMKQGSDMNRSGLYNNYPVKSISSNSLLLKFNLRIK